MADVNAKMYWLKCLVTDVKVTKFTVTDVVVTGFNQLYIVTDGKSHIWLMLWPNGRCQCHVYRLMFRPCGRWNTTYVTA